MFALYDTRLEGFNHRPIPEFISEEDAKVLVVAVTNRLRQLVLERTPVCEVLFSLRAANVLRNLHIRTLGELSEYEGELKGAGKACAEEYQRELNAVGLPVGRAITRTLQRYRHQAV